MKSKDKIQDKKYENQKGITLFISIVIMSILLFISFAVINITIKTTIFASSGRDSQFAFYAADTGIECALFWDSRFDPSKFATSTAPDSITCAGVTTIDGQVNIPGTSTPARIGGGGDGNPTSIFSFEMNQTGSAENRVPYCTVVTVTKYYDGPDLRTYIKSRGYNTCDLTNPRRIERGIEVTY